MIQPAGVISRQSTQIMLVPDALVAKALRYIWQQLHRSLPIEEIADHVGVSLSTLARLFRKHLRRTIGDEIAHSRLERAKELLANGNLRIRDISKACGYSTPNYFNNVFLRATGLTPRKFRIAADPATARSRPEFVTPTPSLANEKASRKKGQRSSFRQN